MTDQTPSKPIVAPGGPIDLSLLVGASFRCRPQCGLCCYTTPAVSGPEAAQLIHLDPATPLLEGDGGWGFVASQGDGGACHFLARTRCGAYGVRPFTCREFPISVHLGLRAQATVVLSCPGVEFPGWSAGPGDPEGSETPQGLEEELAAVDREFRQAPAAMRLKENARRWAAFRRRQDRADAWQEPDEIRRSLGPRMRSLVRDAFPPPAPPSRSEGIESLPIVFEPGVGRLGIAEHRGGWELLSLEEGGSPPGSLGIWPPADEPPQMTPEGERALDRYLDYLLRREFTYWAAAAQIPRADARSLLDEVRSDIGRFGAMVLARAELIDRFRHGESSTLDGPLVWAGVRATDGEFLDRPTLGWVL
ncbi:MAG TPA: YkgJ family cysteine cluster protein [Thermoplasmata archaeon]|nr:YkgJ family cysteine cluster protein [Thermoplasmata archaeon]